MATGHIPTGRPHGWRAGHDWSQPTKGAGSGQPGQRRGRWRRLAPLGIALVLALGLPLATRAQAGVGGPVLAIIPAGRFGPDTAPLLAVDAGTGRAYLAVDRAAPLAGRIDVIDSRTGRLLHTIGGLPAITDFLLAPRAHRLFLRTTDFPTVRILDSGTGRAVRTLSVRPYAVANALAVDAAAGRLYVEATGDCLRRRSTCTLAVLTFDTRTGALLHTVAIPAQQEADAGLAIDPAAHRLILAHAALFLPGTHIPRPYDVTTGIEKVAVFDTLSGRLIRQTTLAVGDRLGGFLKDTPVVDPVSGRTFLVVARPHVYPEDDLTADHAALVFDTRSGRLVRAVPLGAGAAQIAVDGRTGAVFAASYGPLRAPCRALPVPAHGSGLEQLDPSSGAVMRRIATGTATTALAIDSGRGRVYVANAGPLHVDARYLSVLPRYAGPGIVSVVDERSGRVVGRVGVPASPVGLALDPRAQRLFVGTVTNGPYGSGQGAVSVLDTSRVDASAQK